MRESILLSSLYGSKAVLTTLEPESRERDLLGMAAKAWSLRTLEESFYQDIYSAGENLERRDEIILLAANFKGGRDNLCRRSS